MTETLAKLSTRRYAVGLEPDAVDLVAVMVDEVACCSPLRCYDRSILSSAPTSKAT